MRAGLEPVGKLFRDGWQPEEILIRLALAYLDHKSEARGIRAIEREYANRNRITNLIGGR